MIFFSGWGILALLPAGAGAGLGQLIGVAIGGQDSTTAKVCTAIGLLIGSVGNWYLGIWLNKIKAQRDLAKALASRRAQLDAQVASGTFYLGPGNPLPTSVDDAKRQADQLYQAEAAAASAKIGNRHTLMFIPVQYWAFIGAALAVVVLIMAVLGR